MPPSWAAGERACGQLQPGDVDGRGLDQRCAANPAGDNDAGRRAVGGLDRTRGLGFGAPRYGVKPTVMPKPTVV